MVRAGKKLKSDFINESDTGFRVFKLDTSNIRAWNPNSSDLKTSLFDHLEHLETGRSSDDILYEILLKLGLDLCVPIEVREIAGKQVNSVGAGVLMADRAQEVGLSVPVLQPPGMRFMAALKISKERGSA